MENKVTISELPELFYAEGAESIPVDSYDAAQEKNKTFRVSIDVIRDYIESKLNLGEAVTQDQILAWDNKETTLGAQGKADASLVSAKEYTDQELVAVKAAISELEGILASEDVDLDELQEIVDFIKLNRSDLDSLTIASIAGLDDALGLKADVTALEDKVDSATLTSALELKADVSALEDKADISALEDMVDSATLSAALEDKADVSALELKADVSALEDKVETATLTAALELKADVSALEDKVDVSALELKADVSALEDKVDSATLTSALADKADVSALADKADINNSFVVVTEDKTIVNADAGKTLFVTADCVLTVSDYASLDDGFNCKIIVDAGADTVAVEFDESDSVRGDHTEILEDTTLIKTPNEGVFVFFGK